MKKLLSLSLAIVMLLSCMLVQTVAVSAAEAVSSTNAPYAGVYQVTSDKAVTLTNETGHTVTLAAGATDYFYLIKGANDITTTDASANVTFTTLANNGMDYIANVSTSKDLHTTATTYFGPVGEGSYIGDYYAGSENGSCTAGSTSIVIPEGATAILSGSLKGTAGMYYVTLSMEKVNGGIVKVETDTGFYTEHIPTGAGWATFGPASGSDLEAIYLREGANTLKVTNTGSGSITIAGVKLARTNNVADYEDQLNFASFKVIPYVEQTPEVPGPTEAPTVSGVVVYSDAPYAGVYEVTSDKAVTLTNETGHKVTLAADETGYFYLIKGSNKINYSDVTATVSFTALEGNGLDYIDQVSITAEPITPGDSHDTIDAAANITLAPGETKTFTLVTTKGAGLYYPYIAGTIDSTVRVSTDTGYYADILLRGGSSSAWADGSAKSDLEVVYLRDGAQSIELTNTSSANVDIIATRFGTMSPLEGNVDAKMSALKVIPYVAENEPEATPEPTETPAPAVTVTAEGAYAGVYEVTSDKDVTITNFTGHTATLTAGATEYFYLVKGANTIATTDETATLTFTELEDNGMEFLAEVDAGVAPLASGAAEIDAASNLLGAEGEYGTGSGYVQLGVGGAAKIKINAPETGIYYLQIQMNDGSYGDTIYMETDTGFCGTMLQYQWGWHFRTNGASDNDLTMVFLREGEGWLLLENQGPAAITIGKVALCQSAELNDAAKFPQYVEQLDMESCDVVVAIPDSFINDNTAVVAGNTITMSGRIGADWMNEKYGVEFASNKTGTRAQKYYGARPGDTVSDGNGGTTTFTFGEWDGTFEIVLEGVSAGLKEYKFFVGDNYTDAATCEVAAAE